MKTNETEENQNKNVNQDLNELFLSGLADLHNAETQLTKALPKMAKAAQSEELREALEMHLKETENHVSRIEQIFESLGEKLERKTCKAMKGLVEEGDEIVKENKDSSALDAGIIAAAQKVEHYEIASYGTLCAWAEELEHTDERELLQATLEEEKAADEKLNTIAESTANARGE